MGGLDLVFAQYDGIQSGHPVPETKAIAGPAVGPEVQGKDAPPWQPAEDVNQRELQRLGYAAKGFKNWDEVNAYKAKQAEKRIEERLKNPNGASFEQDEAGMDKAYGDETATGVYYDPATKTEYVKGSVTKRDWFDDFTKIPFWGDIHDAERLQQAEQAYNDLLMQGKPVDRVVGHSLGGSVALQLQEDKAIPLSRTFGAPVFDLNFKQKSERYRHPLDPVSILDRSATWGPVMAYPHTYTGFGTLQQ
jgi:hypothetical protein